MQNIIDKKQLREFGLLIAFGFPFFVGLLIPLISGHTFKIWTLFIAIPFFIIGIARPRFLYLPYKGWIKLGNFLGIINSFLLLWLIFIFVLIPIAFIMRIFGYDPLRVRNSNELSYKEKRTNNKIDLTRIF